MLGPTGLSPAADGRRWLVAGPSGSGVSTALATAAASLLGAGRPLAIVSPRPGPLDCLRDEPGVLACSDGLRVDELAAARDAHPDLCLVVDGADGLVDAPVDPLLREIGRLVDHDGGVLVVGANSTNLATQYRGVAVEVSRHRTGLLLRPGSITDADLFGVRIRLDRAAPAGRGHLIRRGGVLLVQVARLRAPDDPGGAARVA